MMCGRASIGWLVAVVAVLGVLPWLDLWHHLPWGADAAKWIERTAVDQPGWWSWSIGSSHFVGYRPVTALSFAMNHAVFGFQGWAYRLVDIALHAGAGVLVWLLYRQWTGDRSLVGLVPVVLMYGHPVTEEVVPFVARRSYLLATAFGLSSLLCLGAAARGRGLSERNRWGLLAGLMLLFAVLSNEVAYVLLPLVPAVLVHQARPGAWRAALWPGLWPLLAAGYALLARASVLGQWGGYHKRYFAQMTPLGPGWRELHSWQPRRIAEACWSYLLAPHGVDGAASWATVWGGPTWALLLAIGLSVFCVVRPILRLDERGARAAALAGAWMVGSTLIVVLSQTWFWRQAAMLLPPLGIVLAVALRAGIDAARARVWAATVPGSVAALALLGMLSQGPLVRGGMNSEPHHARVLGSQTAREVQRRLRDLPRRSRVYLVAANRGRTAQVVRLWGERFGGRQQLDVRLVAHTTPQGDRRRFRAAVESGDGSRRLRLSGPAQAAKTAHVQARGFDDRGGPLAALRSPRRAVWLLYAGSDGSWIKRINGPPDP